MQFYKEENFKEIEGLRVPEDWEVKTLDEISKSMYYGITAKAVNEPTILKMLRTTDIKDYKIDWQNLPYCEITEKRKNNIEKYFIKKGDILISRAGTVGISVLVDKDIDNVIFGSYLIKIDLKDNYAYHRFIYYYLQSSYYWNHIKSSSAGSTLKNINLPILKSLKIPLPPIEEQRAIAKVLNDFDKLIEIINKQIETLNKAKKGMMKKLFTKGVFEHKKFKKTEIGEIPEDWEVKALSEIAEYINGYAFSPKDWGDKGLPIIRIQNLNDPNAEFNYYDGEIDPIYIINNGDLLLSWSGSIGVYMWNRGMAVLNQHIFKVIPKEKVDRFYLYYVLFLAINQLKNRIHGSTMKHFKKGELKRTYIPLPPLEEQRAIAERLKSIDDLIEIKRKEKEQIEKAKKKVMDLLLTGKIRIRR